MSNLGLVRSVVRRFKDRGVLEEDLFQIGCIGLIKAIDRFEVDTGYAFSTYAVPLITGEIKRFLRDDGMVKVSRSIKENASKCMRAAEYFRMVNNREPTLNEIAKGAGIAVEDVSIALSSAMEVESVDRSIETGDSCDTTVLDCIGSDQDLGEEVSLKVALGQLLDTMPELDRRLIELRYCEELTQSQVASILHMSQVSVSRMEKRILLYCRERLVSA